MRRIVILGMVFLAILLVPTVAATLTPYLEGFAGDSGTTPTADWYTFSGSGTGTRNVQSLTTGYMSGNVFMVGTTANGQTSPSTTFTFVNNENTGLYRFDLYCNRASAPGSQSFVLRNENGATMFNLDIQGSGTGNCAVNLIDGSPLAALIPNTALGWTARLNFTVNYATDTYSVERTLFGGAPTTLSGRSLATASSSAKSFLFTGFQPSVGSVNNLVAIDNLDFGDADLPSQPEDPTEFDSGLLTFINSVGFKTVESQFFFSILLVGIATVSTGVSLKFMSPSKLKLILISVTALIVGAFCVLLKLFDFWMYFTAMILAAAILQGVKEFKNTFIELKKYIESRNAPKGGEGDAEDVDESMQKSGPLTKTEVEEVDVIEGSESPEPTEDGESGPLEDHGIDTVGDTPEPGPQGS